jgi:hypothetical protein
VGFEHTIPVFERANTFHALDRAATVIGSYTVILEKLSLYSLRNRRHHLDALFFLFRSVVALNPVLPFWKMLAFVFLPILGTSHCLVFVPLINIVLLLGAPVLPTRWVQILTYLQSEPFLSITFILISLKLLIIFVHNPDVLCYVVLSYHVLVTSLQLCLFVSSVSLH